MVDLAEIQAAYYMVAATGVLVAAVFYILNLQMTRRKLKIDNTILYGNLLTNKEMVLQWRHVLWEQNFTTFEEWDQKFRPDPEAYSNWFATQGLMSQLGMCVQEGLVDFEMLTRKSLVAWTLGVYPKIKPVLLGLRALYNDPLYGSYCDYLYDEVVKRYPDAVTPRDRFKPQ